MSRKIHFLELDKGDPGYNRGFSSKPKGIITTSDVRNYPKPASQPDTTYINTNVKVYRAMTQLHMGAKPQPRKTYPQ